MRAFCFLGLVVLLRVVAAGSPRMPPKTIATIEIKLQVLLSRLKWMQECVCDTVPAERKKTTPGDVPDKDRQGGDSSTFESTQKTEGTTTPIWSTPQDLRNRHLRRCLTPEGSYAELMMEYREVGGMLTRRFRAGERLPLPPPLTGVSPDEMDAMEKAFVDCICGKKRKDLSRLVRPMTPADGLAALQAVEADMNRCAADFAANMPADAIVRLEDIPEFVPPRRIPMTAKELRDRTQKSTNAIVPFHRVAPKTVPGATSKEKPGIRERIGRAGKKMKEAVTRVKNAITGNDQVQKAVAWRSCMGGCVDLSTPTKWSGSFGSCMKPAQCGDPSQFVPGWDFNAAMRVAEEQYLAQERQIQQLVQDRRVETAAMLLLTAVLVKFGGSAILRFLHP